MSCLDRWALNFNTKMRNRPRRAMVRGMDDACHWVSRTSCRKYLFGDEELPL